MYKKFKNTGNPYFAQRHKEQRRKNKKAFRQIKRKYIEDEICKPLEKGNFKPFYKHLRQKQKCQHPLATIKLKNGTIVSDCLKCAGTLNKYFHSQFCTSESITGLPFLRTDNCSIEIQPEGRRKPIHHLKNNRSPGPDQIRKRELLWDPVMVAKCLT